VAVQADWLEKDLYAVLGVAEDADGKTISRAYRRRARELHPDTHPDDRAAAERFKEVTAAYDVVGDPTKRAEYDEFRRAVASAEASERGAWRNVGDVADGRAPGFASATWSTFDGAGLDDLIDGLLGRVHRGPDGPRPGEDLEALIDLDFEDAVRGLTTGVTVSGPGGPRTFKVRIPAGVEHGQRIRLPGKGAPGASGGPPGDLHAIVQVAPHPVFGRKGNDLTVEVPVTWPEAVLGTEIEVPTLDGAPVRVRVPAGTPPGRTLRLRGRGVHTARGDGDLLVSITVTVPTAVTEEQRRAVEAVAEALGEKAA
jgi:molecular chaperone DnaJ